MSQAKLIIQLNTFMHDWAFGLYQQATFDNVICYANLQFWATDMCYLKMTVT